MRPLTRHPSLSALRRFESADLTGGGDARLNRHLAECRRCQNEIRRIRAIRTDAAELLGPPVPDDSWTAIQERLEAGEAVVLPDAGVRSSGRWFRVRSIAGLLLLVGAGAAAALAGPPIAAWATRLFEPPAAAEAPPEAGLATIPQSREVLVKLTANTSEVTIRVRRGTSPLLEVRGRGAAASAEFVLTGDTIEVFAANGGEILLFIPEGITARLATESSVLVLGDSADVIVPVIGEGA